MNPAKKKILFICVHNSARSQMAEAFLKQMSAGKFEAESAGLEPGELSPLAVEAMKEIGIDISRNNTKSAFDFYKQGKLYDYVITVCAESEASRCPVFPSAFRETHWNFDDPAGFQGTWKERLEKTRAVRDAIKQKVANLIEELSNPTREVENGKAF